MATTLGFSPKKILWTEEPGRVQFMGSQKSWTAATAAAKSLQSCPTLSEPMDCSLTGSSVHRIFQARVLEWGAIAFSDMLLEPTLSRVGHFSHVQLYTTPWTSA